jgi:D-glycero-D-manno-heptose 1,7-bisphosphate phosphatase
MTRPAIFFDRDGVIVEDVDAVLRPEQLVLMPGAAEAAKRAAANGRAVVVITNQPVVARGLIDEDGIRGVHDALAALIRAEGGTIDAFYFCPHHPNATLPSYRVACDCRKPRPGLLTRAANDLDLDLAASVMVGDRLSDVTAGARAGCKTVLVTTGKHLAAPIESPDPSDAKPDFVAVDVTAAVEWALGVHPKTGT